MSQKKELKKTRTKTRYAQRTYKKKTNHMARQDNTDGYTNCHKLSHFVSLLVCLPLSHFDFEGSYTLSLNQYMSLNCFLINQWEDCVVGCCVVVVVLCRSAVLPCRTLMTSLVLSCVMVVLWCLLFSCLLFLPTIFYSHLRWLSGYMPVLLSCLGFGLGRVRVRVRVRLG